VGTQRDPPGETVATTNMTIAMLVVATLIAIAMLVVKTVIAMASCHRILEEKKNSKRKI
jgi:hypothetical protein